MKIPKAMMTTNNEEQRQKKSQFAEIRGGRRTSVVFFTIEQGLVLVKCSSVTVPMSAAVQFFQLFQKKQNEDESQSVSLCEIKLEKRGCFDNSWDL